MSATGLTAGAAALAVHPAFWVVVIVISAVLGGIAVIRHRDEIATRGEDEPASSPPRQVTQPPATLAAVTPLESATPATTSLGSECLKVGNAIESFFFDRAHAKPKIGPDTPKDQETFQRAKQLGHDLETELLYRERFDAPVAKLVAALRKRDDVAPEELEGLTSPEDRGAMYRVGETLQRLGKRAEANDPLEPATHVETERGRSSDAIRQRLDEGVAWLRELRHLPAAMAAAMEEDVENWERATQETLGTHPSLLARFNHALAADEPAVSDLPLIQFQGQVRLAAQPRLEARLLAGTRCLSAFLAEPEAQPAVAATEFRPAASAVRSPAELAATVKDARRTVAIIGTLRERAASGAALSTAEPFDEVTGLPPIAHEGDALYEWAFSTWRWLYEQFHEAANAFRGPHPGIDFERAFRAETEAVGRDAYRGRLVTLLDDLIRELESGGKPEDRLGQALANGRHLLMHLEVWDSPAYWEGDEPGQGRYDELPFTEHPLYKWAKPTYEFLSEHYPDYAIEFFGKPTPGGFALAYAEETRPPHGSRLDYLERRIEILARAVRDARRAA